MKPQDSKASTARVNMKHQESLSPMKPHEPKVSFSSVTMKHHESLSPTVTMKPPESTGTPAGGLTMKPEQQASQTRFLWAVASLEVAMLVPFTLLVRYDDSADPARAGREAREGLRYNLSSYPLGVDVFLMLLAGFGYLMTFLKRYGLSALGFTMIVTVVVTQFAIILVGLARLDDELVIRLSFIDIVEGGVFAAAVLISFGVVIGKVNPLELLVMGLLETVFVILNSHVGYHIIGAKDVGGTIFIHTFGAYFGVAVSFCLRRRKPERSEQLEGSRYTSDMFSLLGTIILWVYWPSFNGLLATEAARHRCFINTYISLMASTAWTFVLSGLLGDKRFHPEDIQNAVLAGGVVVGATADMVLQPYGAAMAGSVAGVVATLGYKIVAGKMYDTCGIHDTCGVHNLHGMPGILGGLLSVLLVMMAEEETYGTELFHIFPHCAPPEGSQVLEELLKENPSILPGEGRSLAFQALVQLISLATTLLGALVLGAVTGLLLTFNNIFHPVPDDRMFDDALFWEIAEEDTDGVAKQEEGAGEAAMGRKRSRCRSVSTFSRNLAGEMEVYTGMDKPARRASEKSINTPSRKGSEQSIHSFTPSQF